MKITLWDTRIESDNLGDGVIMDAIEAVIAEVLPGSQYSRIPTHQYLSKASASEIKDNPLGIVCGTNILESHMLYRPQWRLAPWQVSSVKNAILCGTGWRRYTGMPDRYTKWLLRKILHPDYIHSVRDSYSLERLRDLGLKVVNTSCPTMWSLTPERCASIPRVKADSAITTLTYYVPRPDTDRAMLQLLVRSYKEVFFWPQQHHDMAYFKKLNVEGLHLIDPTLEAYNQCLSSRPLDFLGLRLHGGIRALQMGRRALIIPVDNRATEISRDTGLPIMDRTNIAGMEAWISGERATRIDLPSAAIQAWKEQFRDVA
jgi:hypothetical protein